MAKPKYKTQIPSLPPHESIVSFARIIAHAAVESSVSGSKIEEIYNKDVDKDTSDYSGKIEILLKHDQAISVNETCVVAGQLSIFGDQE